MSQLSPTLVGVAPLPSSRGPAAHSHIARFFHDTHFPALDIAEHLAPRLGTDRGAMLVATPQHVQQISHALGNLGVDVRAMVGGPLVMVDAREVADALGHGAGAREIFERHVAARARQLVERFGAVRAYGEIVSILCVAGDPASALEIEMLWNELMRDLGRVELLCGYDLAAFADEQPASAIGRICEEHSAVSTDVRQTVIALGAEIALRRQVEAQHDLARRRLELLADVSMSVADARLDCAGVIAAVTGTVVRWGLASHCAIHLVGDRPSLELAQDDVVVIPLRASGTLLGTLTASRRDGMPPFSRDDERLLTEIAGRAALSLDNALLFERAQRERERAEKANRAKDEFLAMLGHELRNPLSPILTAVQLMRLRAADTLAHERTVIERQVNHMVRLVDDLLDVSRITRGKVELKRTSVELGKIVAEAIEIASPLLEQRRHELRTSVGRGLRLFADPSRLAQVVANLLTNAAKYTPPGGRVSVTARVRQGRVALAVRDNGVGIEPKLLPEVFEHFVQGKQAPDRAQGGLGLGLAIARCLVELHGGVLRASSDGPGKGSEFTVELPLEEEGMRDPTRDSGATAVVAEQEQRRILIVDDNTDAASLLAELLRVLGHVVEVAHDGPSALAKAKALRPDVALLDLGLPLMDGHELARRLTASLDVAPKLVALTGYGQESDRRRTREAGFIEHLVKPVSFERLQKLIGDL